MRDPQTLDGLNARFGIPGLVAFAAGAGDLPSIRVTAPAAEATIYLHGAHVTHHQPMGAQPVLFLSARSRFAPGAAIRGGVPLVFPWFGARAGHRAAPDHGFARLCEWSVESVERAGNGVAVTLGLEPSEATRALWPSEFRLTYRVLVQAALELTLEVENRSKAPFTFEEALHTYLAVGDVREASVTGLEGHAYTDKTDGMKRKTLAAGPFRPSGETDRVFPSTTSTCTVTDPVLGRRLIVEKTGSATTVVWNPWGDKAARMADLGADQWPSMLCVEAANAMDDAVTLGPGDRHAMGVAIRAAAI
jgi:D-hexose-6-phosphate mutarotase